MQGYIIDGQEKDLVQQNWKFLAILDACRYDVFEKVYRSILETEGILKKAISPASWTMEWLIKSFPSFYSDIIYVSGNYFVNSKNKVCRKATYSEHLSFDGKKHFFKIVDVWHHGWNDKLGTVHPMQINKAFHKAYLTYPSKRFILHYVQPHYPYISLGGRPTKKPTKGISGDDKSKKGLLDRIRDELVPQNQAWNLKKLLKIPCNSTLEEWYRLHGKKGIMGIYLMDVELVLRFVKQLVDSFPGKWLITSDHGERFCHPFLSGHGGRHDKEVTEIPWLEINNMGNVGNII